MFLLLTDTVLLHTQSGTVLHLQVVGRNNFISLLFAGKTTVALPIESDEVPRVWAGLLAMAITYPGYVANQPDSSAAQTAP